MLRNVAASSESAAGDKSGVQPESGTLRFLRGTGEEVSLSPATGRSCVSAHPEDAPLSRNHPGSLPMPTAGGLEQVSFRQLLERLDEQHHLELQILRLENSRLRSARCRCCWKQGDRQDVKPPMEVQGSVPLPTAALQEHAIALFAAAGNVGPAQGDYDNNVTVFAEEGEEEEPQVKEESQKEDKDEEHEEEDNDDGCEDEEEEEEGEEEESNAAASKSASTGIGGSGTIRAIRRGREPKPCLKPMVRFVMRPHWKAQMKAMLHVTHGKKKGQIDLRWTLGSFVRSRSTFSFPDYSYSMFPECRECSNFIDKFWDKLLSRCMIAPDHSIRTLWSFLSVLLLAFDFVVVPTESFFQLSPTVALTTMDWISRHFWSFDVPMSFITDNSGSRRGEMRPSRIARDYLKVWFPLDLFLVVTDWLSLIGLSGGAASMIPLLRVVRLLRMLRLIRLGKLRSLFHNVMLVMPESVAVCSGLIRQILVMCLMTHFFACLWYGVGVARPDGWAYELQTLPIDYTYLLSVHWVVAQLHGTAPFHPRSAIEHGVAAASAIFGFLAAALLIGKMVQTVTLMTDSNHEFVLQSCRRYLRTRNVSVRLQIRLNKYLATTRKRRDFKQRVAREEELIRTLPSVVLRDLHEELRKPVLICNSFMKSIDDWLPVLLGKICNEGLQTMVYGAEEYVFCAGDEASSLIVAESGSSFYLQAKKRDEGDAPPATAEPQAESTTMRRNFASRRCDAGLTNITRGQHLSEAALWTTWVHLGDLVCETNSTLLGLRDAKFEELSSIDVEVTKRSIKYCRLFLSSLNDLSRRDRLSDIVRFQVDPSDLVQQLKFAGHHFVFLSHYKKEAGTEAALIREDLETFIDNDVAHSAHTFLSPIFIDSEELIELSALKDHVLNSHNLVVLLTPNVLTRPWCMLEIVTAIKNNIPLVPVEIQRPGKRHSYPTEEFYQSLTRGEVFGDAGNKLLKDHGVEAHDVAQCTRELCQKIAVTYSPHKSIKIRTAEIHEIIRRCSTREGADGGFSRLTSVVGDSPTSGSRRGSF